MKRTLLIFIFVVLPAWSFSLYGPDNRHEVYEDPNPLIKELARSTAVLVNNDLLKEIDGKLIPDSTPLGFAQFLCQNERFRDQPSLGFCSGTLVGPDLLLTAGHCYDESTCGSASWVFDYRLSDQGEVPSSLDKNLVYRCKKVVAQLSNVDLGEDFTLVQLDRMVSDRSPVVLSHSEPTLFQDIFMIGHPAGIPTKVTDGALITDVSGPGLFTNLDAFTGNSGSGVFDAHSGELIGVLSSGQPDYNFDSGCNRSNHYEEAQGKESVVKIAPILRYLSN